MKRSKQIVLILSGAVGAALAGCDSNRNAESRTVVSSNMAYTNNHYLPGAGYYHAPYYAWYPLPYNSYDPARGYYHGGVWTREPDENTLRVSHPDSTSVKKAQAAHDTTVRRSGFGSSSRGGYS